MSRKKPNYNQSLRHLIEKTEAYNRSMFAKKSTADVTDQIVFCQNGMENLNTSSKNENVMSKNLNAKNDVLMVDIISTKYQYENSSFELNIIQQCSIISIISPSAFTIQLTRDLIKCEEFFQEMNEYYNSIDDLQIPSEYLRSNLLCVTYDETISAWNRSQIMEYDLNDDTVNVFFVDLNSWEENVSRSRLRFILTKYSSRPVYVLTCRLASIGSLNNDNDWNDVVSKTFQNIVLNRQCDVEPLCKRSDEMFYVNLFAPHDEAYVCVNDFLIHCKMAKPIDDTTNISMLVDDERPEHSMIALYWKAGEYRETSVSTTSNESSQAKHSSLAKVVIMNENEKLIFAKYNSYIMLPWFTVSSILNELDEEKMKNLANKFGFKPIIIDPLSHPLLCSQLLKLISTTSGSTQISLFSIDCMRKILQVFNYQQSTVFDLLDRARLAEASDDRTFWDQSSEVEKTNLSGRN